MRYTNENFIEKARGLHGDRFDYSKTEYKGYDVPTTFICKKHGEFTQTPHAHLYHDVCCPGCVKEINDAQRKPKPERREKEDPTITFIKKSKEIWGETYGYSKTVYTDSLNKVTITCPVHGDVEVLPGNHLKRNKFSGCPKCNTEENIRIQKEKKKPRKAKETVDEKRERLKNEFIDKAYKLYGDRFDYSKVNYVNNKVPVCIICPEHGEFWQRPNDHICHGNVCPMCGKNGRRNKKYTQEEVVDLASENFGGYYDYSKTVYKAMQKPILVTCPEHGDFWIRAFDHIHHKCGCPEHHVKSSLELKVEDMFIKKNIKYVYQKRFSWLGLQSLDFYLPDYNIAIEVQGEQHYIPVKTWGGEFGFETNRKRDILKKELCEENGVKLLYYTEPRYMKYVLSENKESTFSKTEKLYEKIFSKHGTYQEQGGGVNKN